MANTTRTQIAKEVNNFYDKTLLVRATPFLVHNRFAQVKDIPTKAGTDTIKFRLYGSLTAQTTALSEGVTPSGSRLSTTDITATVLDYGDYVTLTDKVLRESIDPVLTEAAEVLGEQAGDSLDQLCRDVIAAGTTVQYASTATATDEVTASMKLTKAEVKEAVRTLRGSNARPITHMINPSTGYNTVPVGNSYVGICSEDTGFDLDDATGWIPVQKYPNKANVMDNELGSLANVRFVWTTNAKYSSAGGADSNDVHYTLIFGKNAYAQSRISGAALQNIVHPLGSAGTADPLDQRSTSGWKATYVAKITNQNNIVRVEHGVSA